MKTNVFRVLYKFMRKQVFSQNTSKPELNLVVPENVPFFRRNRELQKSIILVIVDPDS